MAIQGKQREALDHLQRALPGLKDMPWISELGQDPGLASLHGNPEFEQILVQLKKPDRAAGTVAR